MRQPRFRLLLVGLLIAANIAVPVRGEMRPPGQFIAEGPHPTMHRPPGKYRTSFGWLLASMAVHDSLGMFERLNPFYQALPDLYRNAVIAEARHFSSRTGPAYYRYADALLRDLAHLQIVTLENERLSLALSSVPGAILADVGAAIAGAGIKSLLPGRREGVEALESAYLDGSAKIAVRNRAEFRDLVLRYRSLLGEGFEARLDALIRGGASVDDLRDMLTESAISAAIGQTIATMAHSPEQVIATLRTQLAMDVAGYRCACVLDGALHRVDEIAAMFGAGHGYKTRLGALLSARLAPRGTDILNVMSGGEARRMTDAELARIGRLRAENRRAHATYLRSLLVDLERLEAAQIAALQKGTARSVLEAFVLNTLSGALSLGQGGLAQAVAILANAGYGAHDTYAAIGDELSIRIQMAALRETVLDQLLPLSETCGCGSGVAVAPEKMVKGAAPDPD